MKSIDKLLKYITKSGQVSIQNMAEDMKFSRQYIHKLIIELEALDLILKVGIPPKVYYSIKKNNIETKKNNVSYEEELFLKQHFLMIDALGNLLEGYDAMKYWCEKQQLPFDKTIVEFIQTKVKYLKFYNSSHFINGTAKILGTKGIINKGIDSMLYLDFYAIERFGKTRLGTLMHYAKQGQNKTLMKQIVSEIKHRIWNLIDEESIDAILYVPPTISRKVQIMDYLQKHLEINLPILKIEKIKTQIIVPQKALSKVFERIANAQNTFVVPTQKKYKNILIIDDAVGSGATINEIAFKIKEKKLAIKIIGLAITGSYKGFEVISEI